MSSESAGQDWVLEKYVSPWALPFEPFTGYIKWKLDAPVGKVTMSVDPHLSVFRLQNIRNAFVNRKPNDKKFEVAIEDVQITGFFGFGMQFTSIPDSDKEVEIIFELSSVDGSKKAIVELTTKIVRPLIRATEPTLEIAITRDNPLPPMLNIQLLNQGGADVLPDSVSPYVEKIEGKELHIEVRQEKVPIKIGEKLFVKNQDKLAHKVTVSGKGIGMIRIGFNYSDLIGNRYKEETLGIIVNIQEKSPLVEVPVLDYIRGGSSPILLESPKSSPTLVQVPMISR